jgi:hypothetical protein
MIAAHSMTMWYCLQYIKTCPAATDGNHSGVIPLNKLTDQVDVKSDEIRMQPRDLNKNTLQVWRSICTELSRGFVSGCLSALKH